MSEYSSVESVPPKERWDVLKFSAWRLRKERAQQEEWNIWKMMKSK